MPLFNFKCDSCGSKNRIILNKYSAQMCEKCGSEMRRIPKPPSSRVTEVLDNGFMAKSIERLADIERVSKEESLADLRKKKEDWEKYNDY